MLRRPASLPMAQPPSPSATNHSQRTAAASSPHTRGPNCSIVIDVYCPPEGRVRYRLDVVVGLDDRSHPRQLTVTVLEVDAAGLMLVGPDGDLRVMASSSEAMRMLELFELQSREGPCLDCYRTGLPVVNQDLATLNSRWPRFAAEALAAGFHSVQALPLRLRGGVMGALNLFHLEAGRMRQADVDAAQALADVATIAILQHRAALWAQVVNEQLNHALNSRIVIEQAKGIVGQREGLNMEQASRHCATTPGTATSPARCRPGHHRRHPGSLRPRSPPLSKPS